MTPSLPVPVPVAPVTVPSAPNVIERLKQAAAINRVQEAGLAKPNLIEPTTGKMDMSTPAPSKADFELLARITERRAANPNAQPNLYELAAINRVLVQQARDRVAAEIEAEANRSTGPRRR